MKEYPKIESLFDRDDKFKFIISAWRLPEFEYLKDAKWLWTEKIDGTNIRVHWDGEKVCFGGRTDNAQIPVFLLAKLQELFPPEKFLASEHPEQEMTLYGEGYGARIQKSGGNYIPNGVNFILFDVLVPGTEGKEWWLKRQDVEDVARAFGVDCVLIVGEGTLGDAVCIVQSGKVTSSIAALTSFQAEGLVLRPAVDLFDRRGHRIIAKIKSKDFY